MQHFSCDLCGHSLREERHVVKMEVYPAFDPEALTEEELQSDHLEEVAELLAELEAEGKLPPELDLGPQKIRFDLCTPCRDRFLQDPLGRANLHRLNFSGN